MNEALPGFFRVLVLIHGQALDDAIVLYVPPPALLAKQRGQQQDVSPTLASSRYVYLDILSLGHDHGAWQRRVLLMEVGQSILSIDGYACY